MLTLISCFHVQHPVFPVNRTIVEVFTDEDGEEDSDRTIIVTFNYRSGWSKRPVRNKPDQEPDGEQNAGAACRRQASGGSCLD